MDGLRLFLGFSEEAKRIIWVKKYRSEHATLIARWLKLVCSPTKRLIKTEIFGSFQIAFGKDSPTEVVAYIKKNENVKEINEAITEVFR